MARKKQEVEVLAAKLKLPRGAGLWKFQAAIPYSYQRKWMWLRSIKGMKTADLLAAVIDEIVKKHGLKEEDFQ